MQHLPITLAGIWWCGENWLVVMAYLTHDLNRRGVDPNADSSFLIYAASFLACVIFSVFQLSLLYAILFAFWPFGIRKRRIAYPESIVVLAVILTPVHRVVILAGLFAVGWNIGPASQLDPIWMLINSLILLLGVTEYIFLTRRMAKE